MDIGKDSNRPSPEEIRDLFSYEPETGHFFRLRDPIHPSRHKHVRKGGRADRIATNGYRMIWVDGRYHLAHRIAFIFMTGDWPADKVDHINRDPGDNRWNNLREASCAENLRNRRGHKNAVVPYKGVFWDRKYKRYEVRIKAFGVRHYIGRYTDAVEAACAYDAAAQRLHGSFAYRNEDAGHG